MATFRIAFVTTFSPTLTSTFVTSCLSAVSSSSSSFCTVPPFSVLSQRCRIKSKYANINNSPTQRSLLPISSLLSQHQQQQHQHQQPSINAFILLSFSFLFVFSQPPPSAIAYGLQNGRLEKCRGDAPCVSTTSVGNPSKFGPPWSYQPETDDPDTAWTSLKNAVTQNSDNGSIVESVDGPDMYYLRAEFPSALRRGIDDVEFRLVPRDALVTYRSASRDAFFIYPIQTPIDTNKNKKRLEEIRITLGWEQFAGEDLYDYSGSAGSGVRGGSGK